MTTDTSSAGDALIVTQADNFATLRAVVEQVGIGSLMVEVRVLRRLLDIEKSHRLSAEAARPTPVVEARAYGDVAGTFADRSNTYPPVTEAVDVDTAFIARILAATPQGQMVPVQYRGPGDWQVHDQHVQEPYDVLADRIAGLEAENARLRETLGDARGIVDTYIGDMLADGYPAAADSAMRVRDAVDAALASETSHV